MCTHEQGEVLIYMCLYFTPSLALTLSVMSVAVAPMKGMLAASSTYENPSASPTSFTAPIIFSWMVAILA